MEDIFTPKQVAAALQVSESSVKRWCDRGEIRTDRTIGGHRRIPLGFLLAFLESTNRRLIDPEAIGMEQQDRKISSPTTECLGLSDMKEQLEQAILSGSEAACRRLVCTCFSSQGGMGPLADDLISPVFVSVGDKWQQGAVNIYQERHACQIIVSLVHELRRLIPEPSGLAPLAMGGTPTGDQYQLGTLFTDMVFREQGWRTTNLGSNIPFASLLSAARKHMPKVFWLSISHVENEVEFLEGYADFAKRLPKGILLLVGGRALNDQLRPKMIYSSYCDGMKQLATLAKTLKSGTPSKLVFGGKDSLSLVSRVQKSSAKH